MRDAPTHRIPPHRLAAVLLTLALSVGATENLVPNPGFEDGSARWSIDDRIAAVTDARGHTGAKALEVRDPGAGIGSNVRSARIPIHPGDEFLVSFWAFLEAGDAGGLGVYTEFFDAGDRRLADATEATKTAATLQSGEWRQTRFLSVAPPDAASMSIWVHSFLASNGRYLVDDVEVTALPPHSFGMGMGWRGGEPDPAHHRDWPAGLRWHHGTDSGLSFSCAPGSDWSATSALRFNMYLAAPTQSTCMVIASSENPDTEGADYYSVKLQLNWNGWREVVIPFNEMGPARSPRGWQHIDGLTFTASGWGQTLIPDTTVTLDGVRLLAESPADTRLDDATLFAALDLQRPELAATAEAVNAGDLTAAKRALAAHLRERRRPVWFFDWRDRPSKQATSPAPESDRAPDQWDYYSTFLDLDWQGWKLIRLRRDDFSERAFVEGKGWVEKKPIGWHWIQYLMIASEGWGLTPEPGLSICFDDVRLVRADGSVTISDFEAEDSTAEGLERTEALAHDGRAGGIWQHPETVTRIIWRDIPHDWRDVEALEFWAHLEHASKARLVVVADSDVPKAIGAAERALRREWSYPKGPGERGILRFEKQIDWAANPTSGEARTHLWNESLNRHFHFGPLSQAYWETGQEKYAREIAVQLVDWVKRNPPPTMDSGNRAPGGNYAWQTLTTGIRLASTWPNALYRCLDSQVFDDETLCTMLKSIPEQARHLVRWPSKGNWLTAESNGLYTAGVLFPEFKEATDWRRIAAERLYGQLDDAIYPDGMEYELAAGYNNWVVSEFVHILELADLNGRRDELPGDYLQKVEKCFDYQLYASMPNGSIPGLNDSGPADVRKSLRQAAELFPKRRDFLFVASGGTEGDVPERTSWAFPWTGHYVMRSGWDRDATFLLFDAGPFGFGHQHEDKLHFVLYAFGRSLILDPGNFSYDHSRWRRYVLSTRGHNTVRVDGQDQNRRRRRDTYARPHPWDGERPADDDAVWRSTARYDFAAGTYRSGYGRDGALDVVHRRRIFWLKPDCFLIADTLTPKDAGEHDYEALFHLDAETASTDGLTVETGTPDAANVTITAFPQPGLSLEVVKGREEEPVQGWANHPWRAIPTAVYRQRAQGRARFLFVVLPWREGVRPRPSVTLAPAVSAERGIAGTMTRADGTTVRFTFADDGRVTVALHSALGAMQDTFTIDGQ